MKSMTIAAATSSLMSVICLLGNEASARTELRTDFAGKQRRIAQATPETQASSSSTALKISTIYIYGRCVGPWSPNTEYREGQDQYCGYVVVDSSRHNIDGRAWDCSRLSYRADGEWYEISLDRSVGKLCEGTVRKGAEIDPAEYHARSSLDDSRR